MHRMVCQHLKCKVHQQRGKVQEYNFPRSCRMFPLQETFKKIHGFPFLAILVSAAVAHSTQTGEDFLRTYRLNLFCIFKAQWFSWKETARHTLGSCLLFHIIVSMSAGGSTYPFSLALMRINSNRNNFNSQLNNSHVSVSKAGNVLSKRNICLLTATFREGWGILVYYLSSIDRLMLSTRLNLKARGRVCHFLW